MNQNKCMEFENKITYHYGNLLIKELPKTNKIIREIQQRGKSLVLKMDMKVMVTENIDVSNGICNGTIGRTINMSDEIVEIKTNQNQLIKIEYFKVKSENHKLDESEHTYTITHEYMPLKQCNALTTHKSQGATLDKVIFNCDGIFENSPKKYENS